MCYAGAGKGIVFVTFPILKFRRMQIANHRQNRRRRRGNNNKRSTKSMILVPSIDVKLQTLLALVRRTGGLGRTKFNLEKQSFIITS